eukprot:403337071
MELLSSIKKDQQMSQRDSAISQQTYLANNIMSSNFLLSSTADQKYSPFTMKLYEDTLKPQQNNNKIQDFKYSSTTYYNQQQKQSYFDNYGHGKAVEIGGLDSNNFNNGNSRKVDDIIMKTHISSHESAQNLQYNKVGSNNSQSDYKQQLNATTSTAVKNLAYNNKITVFQQDQLLQNPLLKTTNDLSALLSAKKKINKALLAAKFAKDTKKSAKATDIRKQIRTARDMNYKPLTGLSKELNYLAKELESVQNNTFQPQKTQALSHNRAQSLINLKQTQNGFINFQNQQQIASTTSLFKDYKQQQQASQSGNNQFLTTQLPQKTRNFNHSLENKSQRNRSLSEKIEEKNMKVRANFIQTSLYNKLKIVSKFEKSEQNHSKTIKEKKIKYKQAVQQEEQRIKIAKQKMKTSMEEYRKVHEEREKQQREITEQKQDFKETIIKSRSEYLKKKNELALNMAKERYEINNILESEQKRTKTQTSQKTQKAKILHDMHIKDIKDKAELKNKELSQKTTLVFQNKVSESEEFKNKIVQDRSMKEIRKKEVIKKSLLNDPSMYMWMQKGASGSRLRDSMAGDKNLADDLESIKRQSIIRVQLQKDFGPESLTNNTKHQNIGSQSNAQKDSFKINIKDEEQIQNINLDLAGDSNKSKNNALKSISHQNSFNKKQPKKVRIKEPKLEQGTHHFRSQSTSKLDIKRLERIVDTEKYDYTNMGYQWDIINGYMGGEKINKKMSYERALALTQESRVLPFEIRKKYVKITIINIFIRERLFSMGQCFKLEKDTSDRDFDNALRFLELREKNYNKEKALQLARKTTCRASGANDLGGVAIGKRGGYSQMMNLVAKDNEADIEEKTNNIQFEVMQNLMEIYAIKDQKLKDEIKLQKQQEMLEMEKQKLLSSSSNQQKQSSQQESKNSTKKNQKVSDSQVSPSKDKQYTSSSNQVSPSKQKQIGQYILERGKKEDLQALRQQETVNNVIRVLARRSHNKAYRSYYEQLEKDQSRPKSQRSSLESINLEIQQQLDNQYLRNSHVKTANSKSPRPQSKTINLIPIISSENSQQQQQFAQTARLNLHTSGSLKYFLNPIQEEMNERLLIKTERTQNLNLSPQIQENIQAQTLQPPTTAAPLIERVSALQRLKLNKAEQALKKKQLQSSIDKKDRGDKSQNSSMIKVKQKYRAQTTNNGSPVGMDKFGGASMRKTTAPDSQITGLSSHRKIGSVGQSSINFQSGLVPVIPLMQINKGQYSEWQLQNLDKIKQKHQQSEQLRLQILFEKSQKASQTSLSSRKFDYIQQQIEQKSMQKIMAQESKQKGINEHLSQIRNLQRDNHKQKVSEQEERRKKTYEQMLKKNIEDSEFKQQKLGKKLQKINNLDQNKDLMLLEQQRLLQSLGLGMKKIMIKRRGVSSLQDEYPYGYRSSSSGEVITYANEVEGIVSLNNSKKNDMERHYSDQNILV